MELLEHQYIPTIIVYIKMRIIDYFKIEVVKDQLVDWQNIFLRQVFQELEVLT